MKFSTFTSRKRAQNVPPTTQGPTSTRRSSDRQTTPSCRCGHVIMSTRPGRKLSPAIRPHSTTVQVKPPLTRPLRGHPLPRGERVKSDVLQLTSPLVGEVASARNLFPGAKPPAPRERVRGNRCGARRSAHHVVHQKGEHGADRDEDGRAEGPAARTRRVVIGGRRNQPAAVMRGGRRGRGRRRGRIRPRRRSERLAPALSHVCRAARTGVSRSRCRAGAAGRSSALDPRSFRSTGRPSRPCAPPQTAR